MEQSSYVTTMFYYAIIVLVNRLQNNKYGHMYNNIYIYISYIYIYTIIY